MTAVSFAQNLSRLKYTDYRFIVTAITISGLVNSEYFRVYRSIKDNGFIGGAINAFDLSIITIFGIFFAINMSLKQKERIYSVYDVLIFLIISIFILIPSTGISSVGVTVLSLYIYFKTRNSNNDDNDRVDSVNFSLLLFALSYNIMWSPLIFHMFMPVILQVDAFFVGVFAGAEVDKNLIFLRDGSTILQVAAGCSSFNNLSVAAVVTTLGRCIYGAKGKARTLLALTASMGLIIGINVVRIGLIALFPSWYDVIHGNAGATAANYAMTVALYCCAVFFFKEKTKHDGSQT